MSITNVVITVVRSAMTHNSNRAEHNTLNNITKNIKNIRMQCVSNGNMITNNTFQNIYLVLCVVHSCDAITLGSIHEQKNVRH